MSDLTTTAKPDRSPDPGGKPVVRGGNPEVDYSRQAVSRLRKRRRASLEQTFRPTR